MATSLDRATVSSASTPAVEVQPSTSTSVWANESAGAPTLDRRPSTTSISSATTERPSSPTSSAPNDSLSASTSTSSLTVSTTSAPTTPSPTPSPRARHLRQLSTSSASTMAAIASSAASLPAVAQQSSSTSASASPSTSSFSTPVSVRSMGRASRPRPASIHYTPSSLPAGIGLNFPPGSGPRRTPLSAGHARRQSSISYRKSDDSSSGPTTPVSAGPMSTGSAGFSGGRVRPTMTIATGLAEVDEDNLSSASAGPYSETTHTPGESDISVTSPTSASVSYFDSRASPLMRRSGSGSAATGMVTMNGRSRPTSMLSVSSETSNPRKGEDDEEAPGGSGTAPLAGIGLAGSAGMGRGGPTLVEQHAELLTFIAKKERKCLDLREELKRHEDDLKGLKKKWESIVARERSPVPTHTSSFASTPSSEKPPPIDSPSVGVTALFDSLTGSSGPTTPTPSSLCHAGGSGKRIFSRHSISFAPTPGSAGKNGSTPLSPDSTVSALTSGLGIGETTPGIGDDGQSGQAQALAALQGFTSPENVAAAKKWIGGIGKGLGGMFGVTEGGSPAAGVEQDGLGTLREEEEEEDGQTKPKLTPPIDGSSASPPPSARSHRIDSRTNSVSSAISGSTTLSNATRATEASSITSASEGFGSSVDHKRSSTSSLSLDSDDGFNGVRRIAPGHSSRSASESSILLGGSTAEADGDRTPLAGTPALAASAGTEGDSGAIGNADGKGLAGLGLSRSAVNGSQAPPAGMAKHGRKRSMFEGLAGGGWNTIGKKWGELANSDTFKNSRKATLNLVDTFERTLTEAIAIDPKAFQNGSPNPNADSQGRSISTSGLDALASGSEPGTPSGKGLPSGVGAFGWNALLPTSASAPSTASKPSQKSNGSSSLADLDWTGFLNGTSPNPPSEATSASSTPARGLRAKSGTAASQFSKQATRKGRTHSTSSSSSSTVSLTGRAPSPSTAPIPTSSKPGVRRSASVAESGSNLMGDDDDDASAMTGLNAPLAPAQAKGSPGASPRAGLSQIPPLSAGATATSSSISAAVAAKKAKRMSMPVAIKPVQKANLDDDDWGW